VPLLLVEGPKALTDGRGAYIWHSQPGLVSRSVRLPSDPAGFAAGLYAALHELDSENWPWIAVQLPPATPEWEAIHDRLRRAAGKHDEKAG